MSRRYDDEDQFIARRNREADDIREQESHSDDYDFSDVRNRDDERKRGRSVKLFVWNNPYPVNYGSSMLFAVAEDLESAKKIASSESALWCSYGDPYRERRTWTHELGEPTRVADLPCAEWHEWSE